MNNNDRKELARIKSGIEDLLSELRVIGEAEQEKYDNLSEGLQASEKGQQLGKTIQI